MIRNGVSSVGLHSVQDHLQNMLEGDFVFHRKIHLALVFIEEIALVGEIRNEKPGKNTKYDGEGTLDEENPLPTIETGLSRKLDEAKG